MSLRFESRCLSPLTLLALSAWTGGCSALTNEVSPCTDTTGCRERFGLGYVCARDGFCEQASQFERCGSTYPDGLFDDAELRHDGIPIGVLYDASLDTQQARAKSVRLALRQAGRLGQQPLVGIFCTIARDGQLDGLARDQAAVETATYLSTTLEVPAIIGPSASSDAEAVFTAIETQRRGKTLLISPSATSPSLSSLDPIDVSDENPGLLWRTTAPDTVQGRAIANDMTAPGAGRPWPVTSVVVLYEQGSYGQGLADAFVGAFDELTAGVGSARPIVYQQDNVDQLIAIATDIASLEVEEVLFISSQVRDVRVFLQTVDTAWEAGYARKGVFLSDGAANTDAVADIPARAFTLVRGTRPTASDRERNPVYLNYRAAYRAEYEGEDPNQFSFAAHSYDAAWLVLYGMAWAKFQRSEISAVNIARGLRRLSDGQQLDIGATSWQELQRRFKAGDAVNVNGASGPLDYDPESEETSSDVDIWVVWENQIATIDRYAPTEAAQARETD